MKVETIKFKPNNPDLPYKIPQYAEPGSSGLDLYTSNTEEVILLPGEVKLVDTNICIEMPIGMEAQVRSRSGLALKNQIFCLNSPGTVDASYRGPIGIIIANFGKTTFFIPPKTKLAQLVFSNIINVKLIEVQTLSDTVRGDGGFGSTGI